MNGSHNQTQHGCGTNDGSLRVVVVGVGRFGALHARVWREAGNELVGLVDPDASRLGEVAARFDVATTDSEAGSLLEQTKPDVVVVASDEDSHAAIAQEAIGAGAHVFVEKPLAMSATEAWAVHDAAARAGRKVVAGHISRFVPAMQRMRAQVVAGAVGDLAALRLRRDFSRSWFLNFGSRVHPVWESCIHDIDLAVFLADSPVERVSAVQGHAADDAAPSVVSAHLQMTSGVVATVESAWLIPDSAPQTMSGVLELTGTIGAEAEVLGTMGIIRQRQLSDALVEWTSDGVRAPDLTLWPEFGGRVAGALRAEVDYAVAVFTEQRPNDYVPLQQVCWGVEAAEAMVRSLATGVPVEIAQRVPQGAWT